MKKEGIKTYAEFMNKKTPPKSKTLADFFEVEHEGNEERDVGKSLEKPIDMPPSIDSTSRKDVFRSIRVREIEKDDKKLLSVSVIYDLEGREIPIEELESLKHETEHWLTYLGMAMWQLSKKTKEVNYPTPKGRGLVTGDENDAQ